MSEVNIFQVYWKPKWEKCILEKSSFSIRNMIKKSWNEETSGKGKIWLLLSGKEYRLKCLLKLKNEFILLLH